MNRGQRCVGVLGCAVSQRRKGKLAADHRPRNGFERPDFRRRQAEPRQASRTRAQNSCRIEGIVEGGGKPSPNGGGAGRRQLLGHNNGGKASISAGAPAQRRPSGGGDQIGELPICRCERRKPGFEISLGMDMRQLHRSVRIGARKAGSRVDLIADANSVSSTRGCE